MCRLTRNTHKSLQNNKYCFAETAKSETNPVIYGKAPIALGRTCIKDELQQKMMSSWVRSKRPRGAPEMTYGRALKKKLKDARIEVESRHTIAGNSLSWRKIVANC